MRVSLLTFLLLLTAPVFAVEKGTARVNVLQELGQPAAALKRGDTEILNYKDGVRVVLRNDHVVEVTGLKAEEQAAMPVAAEPEGEPAESVEPAEPEPTPEQLAEQEKEEKAAAEAESRARAEMGKAILELEDMAEREPEPRGFNVVAFLMELAVKWLMTLVALTLASKYWNSEVPWNGLMLVSIVDVITRGMIGYIGYVALDMMSLFFADEAVAAMVMVGLLRKVSMNQRLALAIQVVITTKVFSIVVGSLVVTMLMRAMF